MINQLLYFVVDNMVRVWDYLNFEIISADDVFPFSINFGHMILAISIISLLLDALQFGDENEEE